jgi:hypothetical protein
MNSYVDYIINLMREKNLLKEKVKKAQRNRNMSSNATEI